MEGTRRRYYLFGPFRLEPEERRLLNDGVRIKLTPKAFDVLLLFVQNAGSLLSRKDLESGVWPDTPSISAGLLGVTLCALKKALGEEVYDELIQNERGRGYRFNASVRICEEEISFPTVEKQCVRASLVFEEEEIDEVSPVSRSKTNPAFKPKAAVELAEPGLAARSEAALANVGAQLPRAFSQPTFEEPQSGSRLIRSDAHEVLVSPEAPVPRPADGLSPTRLPAVRSGKLWQWIAVCALGAMALVAFLALAKFSSQNSSAESFRVSTFTRLTHDGHEKVPSQPLTTDGRRVYFLERAGDDAVLRSVPAAGGDILAQLIPSGFNLLDISPDKTKFVMAASAAGGQAKPLGVLPVTGGAMRSLAGLAATDAAWSPGGKEIAYAQGANLFVARSDGSQARKLGTAHGPIKWLRWSPDGTRLSYSIQNLTRERYSLWIVEVRAGRAQQIAVEAGNSVSLCCANWTPDNKYLVFQAQRDGRSDIWALRADRSSLYERDAKPIQLTAGPLKYSAPLPSLDGKGLFVIGEEDRGELMRFNLKSREFTDFLAGISAIEVSFSRDGQWVAYVTYPEYELWRSRVDGSEALKLTSSADMEAAEPQWSPDGKRIAFMAVKAGKLFKAYVVPAAGGVPEPLIPGNSEQGVPSWSADGRFIAYGDVLHRKPAAQMALHLLDLSSHQLMTIPGSKGLWTARWSPDGRYILALGAQDDGASPSIWLYFVKSREWTLLAKIDDINEPAWSPDSHYVYFTTQNSPEDPDLYRIRVRDHQLEKLANLSGVPLVPGCTGVTPDGSPVIVRDVSSQEIYALDLRLR